MLVQTKKKTKVKKQQPKPNARPNPDPAKCSDKHIRTVVKSVLNEGRSPEEIECARLYALARSDPFSLKTLPCNPTSDPGFSIRWKAHFRGTMTIGTHSNGYILACPYWGFSNNEAIVQTDADYVHSGSGIHTNQAGVTGWVITSPWNSSAMSGVKVVGYGIRMYYTGRALDAAGMVYRLRTPNNREMGITLPGANITGNAAIAWDRVRVNTSYVTHFIPLDEDDSEYRPPGTPPVHSSNPRWNMGFYVAGAVAGTTFSYEIVAYYEGVPVSEVNGAMATMSPEYKTIGTSIDSASLSAEQKSMQSGFSYNMWKRLMASAVRVGLRGYLGPAYTDAVAAFIEGQQEGTRMSGQPLLM